MLTVNIYQDEPGYDDNPNQYADWHVITFGTGRETDEPCTLYRTREPLTIGERPEPVDDYIRELLANGRAFWIQHDTDGVFRPWIDAPGCARAVAGIVVWNNTAKTPTDKASATAALKLWSQWFNGDVYGWQVNDGEKLVDGCRLYYDVPAMLAEIGELLVRRGKPWRWHDSLHDDAPHLTYQLPADAMRLEAEAELVG